MPDDEARLPKKSARRVQIVKAIADGLASERVFGPLTSASLTEKELKLYMHSPLVDAVAALLRTLYPGQQETTYRKRADEAVYWEGDARTVINNIEFMGVQHRPDLVVALPREDLSVAVEVKWGESGGARIRGHSRTLGPRVYGWPRRCAHVAAHVAAHSCAPLHVRRYVGAATRASPPWASGCRRERWEVLQSTAAPAGTSAGTRPASARWSA